MSDLGDKIRQSREAGFSDKDILERMAKLPEYEDKVFLSRQMGRSDKEIIDFLQGQAIPTDPGTTPGRMLGSLARGAVGGIYDVATLPYQLLGDTGKLKEDILHSAPKPDSAFERAA